MVPSINTETMSCRLSLGLILCLLATAEIAAEHPNNTNNSNSSSNSNFELGFHVATDIVAGVALGAAIIATEGPAKDSRCPDVTTQPDFDLDIYISKPWFIQQQMRIAYLPRSQNYCVQAKYLKRLNKGFWGWDLQVKNYAQDANGEVSSTGNMLCGDRSYGNKNGKLQVAPCFLPKVNRIFSGAYWVLHHNETEGYALVSGGQAYKWTPEGCRTGTGTNNAGLWILTREQQRNEMLVEKVRGLARDQGFDISVLNDVDHTDCPNKGLDMYDTADALNPSPLYALNPSPPPSAVGTQD